MVPVTRRRLLAATGITALAGCLSESDVEPSDDAPEDESPDGGGESLDPAPLPDDLATVLGAVPDRVGQSGFDTIQLSAPEPEDEDRQAPTLGVGAYSGAFGLEPTAVDRTAMATYGQYTNQLLVASGSFDADDVDPGAGESRSLLATEDTVEHVEDGFAVLAAGEDGGWDGGLEAATIAADDSELGVLAQLPVAAALEPVVSVGTASVVRLDGERIQQNLDVDLEAVEFAVVAREFVDETTQEMTFVFLFESASATDRSIAETLVADAGAGMDDPEPEYETTGRRTVATIRGPVPEHQLPDDSPDLHFEFSYDGDGTASVAVGGEESANPENLEYLVDGETTDPPWSGRTEPIEPGSSFETEADLLSLLAVRWNDPERDDVSHTLGEARLGAHERLFDHEYDPDAARLTFTYQYEESVDPGRLEVVRRGPREGFQEGETESLAEHVDSLEQGTEVVLEDVTYGGSVVVRVADADQSSRRSLQHFTARPPGEFRFRHDDGRSVLVYRGEEPRSADNYRVVVREESDDSVGGEYVPTDVQWTDEYETLEPEDELELDLEIGTRGRVQWTETEEPVRVSDFRITPDVEFAFDYDEADGEVEITHDGGESLEAAELTVSVFHEEREEFEDAFSEYDTVSEGDSTVVELSGDPPTDGEDDAANTPRGHVVVEYRNGVSITGAPLGSPDGDGVAVDSAGGAAVATESDSD